MFPVRTDVRGPRTAVATFVLIAAATLVFFLQLGLPPDDLDALVMQWGVVPARLWYVLAHAPGAFDLWLTPIVTSMFLHGGFAHLIGNMLFLWVFGRSLESRIGSLRFLALYFGGGFVAAFFQALLAPGSTIPMIGASGAIAAVLGAFLVSSPRSWVTVVVPIFIFPLFFELPAILFLGFWFLEQLFLGTKWALSPLAAQAGGVAWWAHIGGFLTGAFAGIALRFTTRPPKRRTPPPQIRYVWS
jgi:membrane associated rhomboid family serine protease